MIRVTNIIGLMITANHRTRWCWFPHDSKKNNLFHEKKNHKNIKIVLQDNCSVCSQLILFHKPSVPQHPTIVLYFVRHRQRATIRKPNTCSEPCLDSFQMKKRCSISSSNPFYPIAEFNYSSRWVSKLQPSMITVPQRSEHCQALCWISRTRLRPNKSIEQSILSKAWSWPGPLAL